MGPLINFCDDGRNHCKCSSIFLYLEIKTNLFLLTISAIPTLKSIDKNLIIGSGTFGIGWGMVGFCPGPAISSLALLNTYSAFFVLSMLGGFLLTEIMIRIIIRRSKINYD